MALDCIFTFSNFLFFITEHVVVDARKISYIFILQFMQRILSMKNNKNILIKNSFKKLIWYCISIGNLCHFCRKKIT